MVSGITNFLTSSTLSSISQSTTASVSLETGMKALGRPAFILVDNDIDRQTKRYAAMKEFLYQATCLATYMAIVIPIFKNGKAKHQNHIQLGKYGRYRTNVWEYPGVRATNPESLELLKFHPTPKNVAMLHSILLDTSSKNDIVLDCFGGSGSTLLAAERCKRRARLIEIDPRYVDVCIYRWEKETGKTAKLVKNYEEIEDGE